jgi:hypothetical protein
LFLYILEMEKIEILNPRWEEVMRDEVIYIL